MKEFELYSPMVSWLEQYMKDKYIGWSVVVVNSHSERLDRVLFRHGIVIDVAIGIDIQIDVLGIAKKLDKIRLVFVEAKCTRLTLRDLGQLWAYCKLIDPYEAFILTSQNIGSLDKILRNYGREDILDFGDGKKIKKMMVGEWSIEQAAPNLLTMVPKI